MAAYDHLPPGVLPFLVARDAAAALLGVSGSHFDKMVKDGRLPEPRKADTRVLWDTEELRVFARRLPRRGESGSDGENAFDVLLGP